MRTDEKQNPGRIFVLRKPQSQRRSDLNTDIDDDDDNTDADDDDEKVEEKEAAE